MSLAAAYGRDDAPDRGTWMEGVLAGFVAAPLLREFVFLSPRRPHAEDSREVVDILIACNGLGILVSQKCQGDNPDARDEEKTTRWVLKEAQNGADQLQGALKHRDNTEIWCDHPVRGRVSFKEGLPAIRHAVVIVETFYKIDLEPKAEYLPLELKGVPVSYFSMNDFMNIIHEMRTLPEIIKYLDSRRALPQAEIRHVGEEGWLFMSYLYGNATFPSPLSREIAHAEVKRNHPRVDQMWKKKRQLDEEGKFLESIAHELSNRDPMLPKELESYYEPADNRQGYLKIQAALSDTTLADRVKFSRFFKKILTSRHGRKEGISFAACGSESQPDIEFVFGWSKRIERKKLLGLMHELASGASSHYDRSRCLVVINRDKAGHEFVYFERNRPPSENEQKCAEVHFAHLRTTREAYSSFTGDVKAAISSEGL
ncbi:MAG: hypothetical protein JST01_22730 [Cyanobacteria bacterium SZAS TMP-1]|nr:hypothetical protein [Cyanobacteria bacterium SZAS TMP-1]